MFGSAPARYYSKQCRPYLTGNTDRDLTIVSLCRAFQSLLLYAEAHILGLTAFGTTREMHSMIPEDRENTFSFAEFFRDKRIELVVPDSGIVE